MPKQPSIKINDRVWRYLDDDKKYYGTCIRMTDKGVRCKRDDFPEVFTTVLLYKNYGKVWEKVKDGESGASNRIYGDLNNIAVRKLLIF